MDNFQLILTFFTVSSGFSVPFLETVKTIALSTHGTVKFLDFWSMNHRFRFESIYPQEPGYEGKNISPSFLQTAPLELSYKQLFHRGFINTVWLKPSTFHVNYILGCLGSVVTFQA